MSSLERFTVAFAVLLIATTAACGQGSNARSDATNTADSSPALTTYTNTEYHFSVSYPPSMFGIEEEERTHGPGEGPDRFTWAAQASRISEEPAAGAPERGDRVFIQAARWVTPGGARVHAESDARSWEKVGWPLERTRFAGLKGYMIANDSGTGSDAYRLVQCFLADGRMQYTLSVACRLDIWPVWGEHMMGIVESFKVTE